jgi:putative Ig domain-containing protein/fibronectin type III domain protein/galactose oxidase-like protein
MRPFAKVLWSLPPIALLAALLMPSECVAQVAGQNVNMVSGTQWPTGDPFLQRQNEPSMAVSTRNPMHIMAGANDYRTVDLETLLTGGTETGDSWLGLFKSFDGGLTWQSTLLPGCPELVTQCTDNNGSGHPALQGIYGAASDPVVRAGTNGMFYYAGLAFVRPASGALPGTPSAIFVARYNDLNNNENSDPIAYIDTHSVAIGNTAGTGQFLDKPALAVDIPRAGANTCSFTATEPGVTDSNGQPLTVHQSFAAGNVYVAYTEFLAANKNNSTPTQLMFTRSTDCGVTWSTPVQINKGTITSQGSAIAVNPVNGNVYVAWRQFASTGVSNAIMVAQSTNAGRTFSAPVQISTFQPFDQNTTGTSFRTNAYPSITTDMFGFVYVAFSAKGLGPSGDARVVAAGSIDGTHWTPAIMVDNPKRYAVSNPSGRGHQVMPAITFANGRLTILYYDLRYDHYVNFYTPSTPSGTYASTLVPEGELAAPLFNPNEIFTPYIDDFGLTVRRHTIDLRVLELGIFPTVTLGPSVSVSQYAYGCCVPPGFVQQSPTNIEQYKFNVPNLPLFANGSEPFLGDYIEVVPSPMFVPHGSGWAYNFTPSVNPLFHATWTDNRDVVPPADGNWQNYTPPIIAGTTGTQMSIFEPGQTLPGCQIGQEGMRNQNIYTAQITGGLVVGAPGNAKPLGTTTFTNPVTGVTSIVPFQRAFAVEAENVSSQQIFVRFTIANQPSGGSASFLQFSQLTTLDVTIPQYSSVSRSVFVTSTNPEATVTVNVAQINAIGGTVVTNGLSAMAVLNPDTSNPNIQNPNVQNPNVQNPNVQNAEVTDPNIGNPNISNPNVQNPNIGNPNIQNPNIQNPNVQNPNIGNPNIGNVSATSPNVQNPNVQNPDTPNPNIQNPNIGNPNVQNNVIEDVIYPMTNNGNTTATYTVQVASASSAGVPAGIVVQLILNKLYQTPMAENCQLGLETHWVTVANIINPKLYGPGTAGLGNPNIQNPTPNEGSVTLAPGETVYVTLRVQNPEQTPAQQQFNPVTAIAPVTVPQAVNTTTVLSNPGNTNLTGPVVYPQLGITTPSLPFTDRNDPNYSVQLTSQGGKPGPDTWSVVGGQANLPPGLTLSPSGLLSGTATTPGAYGFAIQVADSATPANTAVRNYTVNVSTTPLSVQTVLTAPDGVVNQQYVAFPLVATGGTTPYVYTAPGLPPGLSINPSTGQITGTPTVANPAGTNVTITATDAAFPAESVSTNVTTRVGAVIQIAPALLPSGTIGVAYSAQLSATGGIGGYSFGVPSPVAGVLVSSSGLVTIANPQSSSITFGATVHDSANPNQVQTTSYTVTFGGLGVGGHIAFTSRPLNSTGGQLINGGPITVLVTDSSNSVIQGAMVTMSFNGTPPCASAILGGTLSQLTSATGVATFPDLTVDRGQISYTLLASVGPMSGVSPPFTVNGFCGSGGLSVARTYPSSTLLQDGTVLVAGGQSSTGYTNVADLYNPATGTSTATTGTLQVARAGHSATLLGDGTVLIVGGTVTPTPPSTNPFTFVAELYSPITSTFTQLANSPNFARSGHTATLLGDGTVLIAGGISQNGSGPLFSVLPAEIYNPAAQTFTIVGSLNVARQAHTATLLANGQVLIASGLDNTAERYDPVKQTFSLTASLNTARQNASATLLSSGKVLIAGGLVSGAAGIGTAELYDPVAGTFSFTNGGLNTPRGLHAATALPDGTVLIAGGYNCPPPSCNNPILGSTEIYTPTNSSFVNTGNLVNARYQEMAILLNDGTVLLAGGFSGNSPTATTERYYSTSTFGPMVITTTTPGQTGTTSYTNPTAFGGAASSLSTIGFNGILPAGATNQDFNPLLLSGVSFFTPQPSTLVNVTTSTFYTPSFPAYPADFIVDSANSNASNQLVITLPAPTYAVGLTYGALGFKGTSSGNITFSNGYVLPFPAGSLPTVGQTQFAGFTSGTPFTALTYTVNSDDWVLLNLQLGTGNVTLANAIQNAPYTQVLLEQGGVGALTWTQTGGTLPPGISLSAGGVLHGTPTATGVYNFTVGVTDSSTPQKVAAAVNFTLSVVQQLVVTTTTLPNATEGVPYTATILTSGGTPPIFFSLTNASFPPGLTITQPAVSSTSDTLAGTPTLAGIYNFTESVADSGTPQQMATQGYTVTVSPQPATNLIGSPQGPGIITLTWTPSTSGDVVSYKVYRGTSSGNYTTTINAGNTNSFVNTGLTTGTTYFFVVTAVSASGVESPFSNEVMVISP